MKLARWVTPQALKEINLGLMLKGAQEIGGVELKKRTREDDPRVHAARVA